MSPPYQRFDPGHEGRPLLKTIDRLVMQFEFIVLQRLAQSGLQFQMVLRGVLQRFAVVGEPRLAGRLGSVEGKVGGLQDIQRFAVIVQWGDANTGADHQDTTVQVQGLMQVVENALGYLLGVAFAGEFMKQYDELISAEAE